MKTERSRTSDLPAGFTINPALDGKYSKDPFFVAKAEKMKKILEKAPIPKHLLYNKK